MAKRSFLDEAIDNAKRIERQSIVELLEAEKRQCEKAGLFANDPILRSDLQTLYIGIEHALEIINKEQK